MIQHTSCIHVSKRDVKGVQSQFWCFSISFPIPSFKAMAFGSVVCVQPGDSGPKLAFYLRNEMGKKRTKITHNIS